MTRLVPAVRVRPLNAAPVRADRSFVLYWMVAARRLTHSFALQHAVEWAQELGRPLVILEALRAGYPFASDRLHAFVLQGMADNARYARGVRYFPYVEPAAGAGRGLLRALAGDACVVVTDDYPAFFLPRMQHAAAKQLDVLLETVDGNGLLPMRAAARAYPTAYAFRRFLQSALRPHLCALPAPDPLRACDLPELRELPAGIEARWPRATSADLRTDCLARLPIDHGVAPAPATGGPQAAGKTLRRFLDRLECYDEGRNHPDEDAASGLSPYLHFGHVGAHQVFTELTERVGWSPACVAPSASGSRRGWWGAPRAEAFLDQLITWRELGFNLCWQRTDYAAYDSLPEWSRRTLADHAGDARPHLYDADTLARAETHDRIWNAAQRQLVREGRLHNYLRMLWGKKILEWSPSPRDALAVMLELNDRYALDGRDPNSASGILWCLGRYDRPWGPERPIFGTVRYMSSANTVRKLRLRAYLERFAA